MSVKQDTSLQKLISVVIPIFNEEDGIEQLRERLFNLRATWENVELEFIFVDDGSSDQTVKGLRQTFGADPLSQIVVHEKNKGVGAAFRTGFARCRGSLVCTIDADCTYGPENLKKLVATLDEQKADIAVASPYHPQGKVDGVAPWRLTLSKGCSAAYWLVAPVRLYTYTAIFRAYRREVIDNVSYEENGFVFTAESLIRAAEMGYKVVEVPMTLHSRMIGQTKMKVARTMRGHLRLILKTAVRRLTGRTASSPIRQKQEAALP
ncbi:MAG: glycosyltransferase family 2 protein [Acidobacteria bacterium]|jgi:dolichol-phosphate mannosyltransferase|nr:glycosyltransferase family 2 protein [Acidobacteriota bacterium]